MNWVNFPVISLTILLSACVTSSAPRIVIDDPEPKSETNLIPASEVEVAYEKLTFSANPALEARNKDAPARSWPTITPEAISSRAREAQRIQEMISDSDLEGDDQAILTRLLNSFIHADAFDTSRIPFTGDSGFHTSPIHAAMQVRIKNAEEAWAWIERLNDLPRYFSEHTINMKRGIRTGWAAYSDPLATVTQQVQEQAQKEIADSILYSPFTSLPDSISDEESMDLKAAGSRAVFRAIQAYRDMHTFLLEEYAPNARSRPGIASLPRGREAYAIAVEHHTAGAGYSVEEIHQLGLQEVARIRSDMNAIIRETGFDGSFADFVSFLRTDPQFYAESAQELIQIASAISKRLDAILPRYFNVLPRLPYGVEAVPMSIAPGYTTGRYLLGDAKLGRAGTYWVNTYALDQRPLYQLPALSAHEAVPGHHLQIALAQEMENRPQYRTNYYATAFGEGWGLYAERIAGEAGIYTTPYERFGALSYEMWRACRLVADTGLHHYDWSRDRAEQCFKENTALAPHNIKTEVTRYIGWPGQATAYKIGELKIRELRNRAETAFGDDFDIREFHDVLLGAGSLPMDRLEIRIDDWISKEE